MSLIVKGLDGRKVDPLDTVGLVLGPLLLRLPVVEIPTVLFSSLALVCSSLTGLLHGESQLLQLLGQVVNHFGCGSKAFSRLCSSARLLGVARFLLVILSVFFGAIRTSPESKRGTHARVTPLTALLGGADNSGHSLGGIISSS